MSNKVFLEFRDNTIAKQKKKKNLQYALNTSKKKEEISESTVVR